MSKIIKSVSVHNKPKLITPPQQAIIKILPDIEREANAQQETNLVISAEEEAKNILSEAAERAAQLLDEANTSAENLKYQAHQEGYQTGYTQGQQEGYAYGLNQAEAEIEKALIQSNRIVASAQKEAETMIMDAEKQIIEIALSIARKVLKREIEENPMTILPVVREALGKTKDAENIVIRVNPEDTETVHLAKRDLQQIIGGDKTLSIIADHTINLGGCMIDTKFGTIDATIDTQFEAIKQALQLIQP